MNVPRALSAKRNAAPHGFEGRHSSFVFEKYPGSAGKVAALPLGQRVLMLLACVHHDITGADGLAKAIVVDHGLNAICIF